jgi:RNA polymerase sigma factor (TIGR02999 family)
VADDDDITALLKQWEAGDRAALDQLAETLYRDLRRIAGAVLSDESGERTMQRTALVHELYLKLVEQKRARWENRAQFFAVAAQLMRRILVDRARRKLAAKRGGDGGKLPLDEALEMSAESGETVVAIDRALRKFAGIDPAAAQLVEMRYFGGLSLEEIADLRGVSRTSVKRDWSAARMWLHRELGAELDGRRALG